METKIEDISVGERMADPETAESLSRPIGRARDVEHLASRDIPLRTVERTHRHADADDVEVLEASEGFAAPWFARSWRFDLLACSWPWRQGPLLAPAEAKHR